MELVQKLLKYDAIHKIAAGTSIEDKLFMYSLLREIKPKSVLEIGVSRGHMTTWLAASVKGSGRLTSVDNWSRAHGGEATSEGYALKRCKETKLDQLVTFVKSDSLEFLEKQEENSFDVVWVDGDHSYEGALADIKEAIHVASKVVAVHDTHQKYDGPRRACEEIGGGFWMRGQRGIWLLNIE